jgi:hypothetical protein
MSKFLVFTQMDKGYWSVHNRKKEFLGIVYFDAQWRKIVWEIEGFKFDAECLGDIKEFLEAHHGSL